jgi:DNA-binding PadR family transcriptional regulator
MNYTRRGARGLTRVWLTRKRRRVLLALLSEADNLHSYRLCETAQVGTGMLRVFLGHLEEARWIEGHFMDIAGHPTRCYSLTALGRRMTIEELRLVYGRRG